MSANQLKVYRTRAVLLAGALLAACAAPKEVLLTEEVPVAEVQRDPLFHDLADSDLPAAEQTVQTALETTASGAEFSWRSPNGVSLDVTPLRTFRIATSHYCRDFRVVVQTAAITRAAARTACRTDEGLWVEVEPTVEPPPQ